MTLPVLLQLHALGAINRGVHFNQQGGGMTERFDASILPLVHFSRIDCIMSSGGIVERVIYCGCDSRWPWPI